MSDFKAKMHQIRFVQGLPQTPLGELAVLPIPLAVFKVPTSRGEKGGEGRYAPIWVVLIHHWGRRLARRARRGAWVGAFRHFFPSTDEN